jgi:predicted GH43/DUF377 family glycosyl hydrolase
VIHSRQLVLEPQPGSPWADEMVLNPGIIQDPRTGRIHMLFRATGPWPAKRIPGRPLPYPIFLGYAWSDDRGATWESDFSRPALAPALRYDIEGITIRNADGERVVNHANGCIEDPRLLFLEGQCYLVVACRLMPPGPYWIHDDPSQCAPDWIRTPENPFGKAASHNVTVNVLYRVDLDRLAAKDYDRAFQYVIHLTDPERGEDRDVVLFPERMTVGGRRHYVCIHRPVRPENYPFVKEPLPPSIFVCAADDLKAFRRDLPTRRIMARPLFAWEGNRIGASAPPLRISDTEWLLCYHGKQDDVVGYTQSFMILEDTPDGLPTVRHRCPDRLMFAREPWELPHKFKTPCVFVTGLIRLEDGTLMLSYGGADERAGIARADANRLIAHVRGFDEQGCRR